jgi:hypothetical protein
MIDMGVYDRDWYRNHPRKPGLRTLAARAVSGVSGRRNRIPRLFLWGAGIFLAFVVVRACSAGAGGV